MAKRAQLVCQHLENISRDALERYQDILKVYIRRRHGIYALYRKGTLYYVGLASNLRSRLTRHLKDKHKHSWDRFSVYLTLSDSHKKELESLVLRIFQPKGNAHGGGFYRSENLLKRLVADFRMRQRKELMALLGRAERDTKPQQELLDVPLAPYVSKPMRLRGRFKGKLYKARLRKDGQIRFNRKTYATPSSAGAAVRKRSTNGWYFWLYERSPNDWVKLKELRK